MVFPLFIIWALMALTVLGLFLWRRSVASKEDDNIHISDAHAEVTAEQTAVAQKLEQIDKWGKLATIVALVFGLIVGGIYLYQSWMQSAKIGV